jgi:hypothetical protein
MLCLSASVESDASLVGFQVMVARDATVVFQRSLPEIDMREWHIYRVELLPIGTRFFVDGNEVAFAFNQRPNRLQKFEIWIDNYRVQIIDGKVQATGYLNVQQDQRMYIDWVKYYNYSNRPPAADNQSVTTDEDTAVGFTLTASDDDGDPLEYIVVTNPANGTLSGTAPNLTYTPNPGYTGPDSFTFKANDSTADSNVATVTITVNPGVDCLADADCDDALFCNGAETCVDGACQAGTAINCDDGLFCNGTETCDAQLGCQAGSDPCSGFDCDEVNDVCIECYYNSDCDDGLFCNGQETCDGGTCQAGTDPCPGQTCDEQNDECVAGPTAQLESGSVTVGGDYVTVELNNTYVSPVVVCSVQYNNNTTPVVARVSNVTSESFDVRLQNPSGGAVVADNVSYVVVEEGVWTIDGVNIEAQTYLSTVTDENNSWVGQAQNYGQSYTSPVVVGQVLSENDTDWSVFWCQGSSRTNPPSTSALTTGKTVCEDTDTSRANETIGFIVFEAGHGTIGGVEFEALVGTDTVRGRRLGVRAWLDARHYHESVPFDRRGPDRRFRAQPYQRASRLCGIRDGGGLSGRAGVRRRGGL